MKDMFKFLLIILLFSACRVTQQTPPPLPPDVMTDTVVIKIEHDYSEELAGSEDYYEYNKESADSSPPAPESAEYNDNDELSAVFDPPPFSYDREIPDQLAKESNSTTTSMTIPTIREPGHGLLSYSVDDTMKVGETHDVILRISRRGSVQTIEMTLPNATTTVIETSSSMEVLLFDPDPVQTDQKFVILNITTAEQSVENDTLYTEWAWKVKPIKSGDHQLKLVITMRQKTEFGSSLKSIKVFERVIKIKSTPAYSIRVWFNKYWTWLFGSLIIPFILFLYKKWKERQNGADRF